MGALIALPVRYVAAVAFDAVGVYRFRCTFLLGVDSCLFFAAIVSDYTIAYVGYVGLDYSLDFVGFTLLDAVGC